MTEFVKGIAQKFVATRDFALNFDDRKIPSTKIRKGDIILYDGLNASYDMSGNIVTGRCMSMKSAINIAKWLIPVNGTSETVPETDKFSTAIKAATKPSTAPSVADFDPKKGGNFDSYLKDNNDGIFIAKTGRKVIKEEERVVKNLEIVGDQVNVKDLDKRLIVNSTTSVTKKPGRVSLPIVQTDGASGEQVASISLKKVDAQKGKNSYIVDDTTPRPTNTEMSIQEVRNITQRGKIVAAETQEGVVIKKINIPKMEVTTEGITLKKYPPREPAPVIEGITMRKVAAPKDFSIKTTVSSGGGVPTVDAAAPIEQESIESLALPKLSEDSSKRALERAEARKKSATATQKSLEQKKPVEQKKSAEQEKTVVASNESGESSGDFLSMLPDDWGKMHWVKKEMFINELEDIDFLKFILSVETIKAVQNACVERLKTLEQKRNG